MELSWLGRVERECRAVPGLDLLGQSTVKVSRFKAQGNKSKGLLSKGRDASKELGGRDGALKTIPNQADPVTSFPNKLIQHSLRIQPWKKPHPCRNSPIETSTNSSPCTFILEFSSQAHQHEVQMIPSRIRNPTAASNTSDLVFPPGSAPAFTKMTQIPQLCWDGTGRVLSQEQVLITPALCHWEGSDGCNKPSQITHYYHRSTVSQESLLPMCLEAVLGTPATHPCSSISLPGLAELCPVSKPQIPMSC